MAPKYQDAEVGLLREVVKPQRQHHEIKHPWRTAAVALITFVLLLGIIFAFLHADSLNPNPDDHPLDGLRLDKGPLNVLIIGDWGRRGQYNQSLVARQMGRVGQELDVDFIVSTGDNFYKTGLNSIDDDNFEMSFTNVYTEESLQKRWYAVLGNHDYKGDETAEVDKRLQQKDTRWWCDYFFTIPVSVGPSSTVEFFMIDTSPMVEKYWEYPESLKRPWRRPIPREEVVASTLANLNSALEQSSATWKIVVGHHTMYSYGTHRETPEMVEKVLPILEDHKVDLYINGHDHCLEHVKRDDSDIHFVTSGGGSKAWNGEFDKDVQSRPDVKLYYDGQGFISLSASPSTVLINFFDITGLVLHKLKLEK